MEHNGPCTSVPQCPLNINWSNKLEWDAHIITSSRVRATGGRAHFFRLCLAAMRVRWLCLFCSEEQRKNKFTGGMREGQEKLIVLCWLRWIFTSLVSWLSFSGRPAPTTATTTFLAVCDFKSRVAPLTREHETNAAERAFSAVDSSCLVVGTKLWKVLLLYEQTSVYFHDNLSVRSADLTHTCMPIILSAR